MPVMKGPAHAGPFHVSTLRCGPDRPARTAAGGTLDGPIRQRRIRSAYASWHGEHGEGEPLALLHPGGADARAWAPNLDAAAARLHVFTPERRGHGPTPDVEGPITYELIVQDTIEFLERVVGGPAHLVGRSAGASVALLAALRRPDLARRLVLIAGVFHRDAGRSSQVARQATVGDLRSCRAASQDRSSCRDGLPRGHRLARRGCLRPAPHELAGGIRAEPDVADPALKAVYRKDAGLVRRLGFVAVRSRGQIPPRRQRRPSG